MGRDEAVRAAAEREADNWLTPKGVDPVADLGRVAAKKAATAGADAELAQVLAFMREDADAVESTQTELDRLIAEAIRELADALEARAHWKGE